MTVCPGPPLSWMIIGLIVSILVPSFLVYLINQKWQTERKTLKLVILILSFLLGLIVLIILSGIIISLFTPPCGGITPSFYSQDNLLAKIRTDGNRIELSNNMILLSTGEEQIVSFAIQNTEESPLSFLINFELKNCDNKTDSIDGVANFLWDTSVQSLKPMESKVYKFMVSPSHFGMCVYQIQVLIGEVSDDSEKEFTSANFFVEVRS